MQKQARVSGSSLESCVGLKKSARPAPLCGAAAALNSYKYCDLPFDEPTPHPSCSVEISSFELVELTPKEGGATKQGVTLKYTATVEAGCTVLSLKYVGGLAATKKEGKKTSVDFLTDTTTKDLDPATASDTFDSNFTVQAFCAKVKEALANTNLSSLTYMATIAGICDCDGALKFFGAFADIKTDDIKKFCKIP